MIHTSSRTSVSPASGEPAGFGELAKATRLPYTGVHVHHGQRVDTAVTDQMIRVRTRLQPGCRQGCLSKRNKLSCAQNRRELACAHGRVL